MSITVRTILEGKGAQIWSVEPDTSVFDALALMADRDVGAVLVIEGGAVKGMLSERDYARQVILKGKASKDTPVREIMTAKVVNIRPEQTVDDCMTLMTAKRIRHLPVVDDNGTLLGLLSIGDVVKAVISEKQQLIDQLEGYITQG